MITEREIRKAAEKLKNNKSPFSDKIRNEMIKASIDTLMPVYEKLSNSILNQGTMPQTRGGSRGRVQGVHTPPPPPEMTCGFLIQLVFCKKKLCGLLVLK